ncbi:MAG: D-alanyl-D-alanine carboxypeptidase [Pyrinomonadaceae bacterium]|nr:D-alanyl-D-alanine carboxypeptidase [Pyrinomonadaceae bacterium]
MLSGKSVLLPCIAMILLCGSNVLGQTSSPRPLLQDIKVYREDPVPAATPLVKRTGSSMPTSADVAAASSLTGIKTSIPLLAETPIPGYSGVLVESMDGKVLVESGSELAYNPASNVKVATTYAVLKSYGPNYRFPTNVWTDGSYEQETATIHGNLYISGKDPVFSYEDAIRIANVLNQMGIRTIKGDLVVTDNFGMNYSASPTTSSKLLYSTLDAAKRSSAATRAWGAFRINSGQFNQLNEIPSVTFTGAVYVQPMPGNLNLLFTHESAPMKDIVKTMMCFSNNQLSEALGDMVGGPYAIARTVQQDTGSTPLEFSIQTASGLGINRVTPRAMMKLLRQLRGQLDNWKMSFADIMPVAGLDDGTLEGLSLIHI